MGIQGLLPFLKAIHTPVNIADFQGSTVAIDAYCWLHKGAFSCAEKLALGEKTDQYVYYCMKYVEYMLRKNLKPILVFDGCHLKSKADVEKTRKERRELHKKKAAQFLREGKRNEAKECLQRCVDITPQMALDLMNACRDRGVDCIVAPYEADAQLAFLNLSGVADIIVTEDSDLLLFGCEKIIFKMDFFGNGTLIEKSRLNEVLAIKGGFYTFEKFRQMCILSGCDYLPSLPGIGLGKACKVMKTARQPDIRQLLKKLSTYLKSNLTVPDVYIEGFVRAENTFLYQLVFDPLNRRLCPLNSYPPELEGSSLDYAGEYIPEEKAFQIALGNIDIHNFKCIAYFDPDTFVPKNAARPKFRHQLSIWSKNYSIRSGSPCKEIQEKEKPSLQSKEQTIVVRSFKRSPAKQVKPATDLSDMKNNEELVNLYVEDGENTSPSFKSVSRNLFNCSPTKNSDDQKMESSKKSTLDKIQSTHLQIKEDDDDDDDNLDDSKHESSNSDDDKSRRSRKRKMPTTPSRPSAADIGEDAFKAANTSSQENSNRSHTPSKGRNVFAVQSNFSKLPKFDLNTPAVEVKSRFFVSGGSSGYKTGRKNASPAKQSLQSSQLTSSKAQKNDSKMQKSIRHMFENAPICTQQNSDAVRDSKPVIKKGMYRFINSPSSELLSAKDSFQNLSQRSSSQSKEYKDKASNKEVITRRGSNGVQQPLSCFDKFNSSFHLSNTKNNLSRTASGSAFDWSKDKSGLEISNLKLRDSFTPQGQLGCIPDKKYIKLEKDILDNDNISQIEEPRDDCLYRCNKQINCQDICKVVNSPIDVTETLQSVSNLSGQGKQRSTIMSLGCVTSELATDNLCDEVTELQSCSYDDFIKSLNENNKSCLADTDKIVSEMHTSNIEIPQDQTMTDSMNDSVNQLVMNGDTEATDNLIGHSDGHMTETNGMSISTDEVKLLSRGVSDKTTVSCSLDTKCYSIQDDFIDLTNVDTDANSQTSNTSNMSRSSNPNTLRQSKCRISGLSKSKAKTKSSVKTSSPIGPSNAGVRSIKDIFSKFQYRR